MRLADTAAEALPMTSDEFAEALRRLISEAEDAGVGLPTLIKVLEEQIHAMEEAIAE